MDELLPLLLSFPKQPPPPRPLADKQNDEQLRSFAEKLRKVTARQLLQPVPGEEGILDLLSPAINTISYSFVLLEHIKQFDTIIRNPNNEQLAMATSLWFNIVDFLNNSDLIQVRYVGGETREIIAFLEPLAHALGKPGAAVAPIARFILRLDPQGSTFSSQHLLLCQISLRTGTFDDAAQVLEHDILFVPSATSYREHKYICSPHLSPRHFMTDVSGLTKIPTTASMQEYFLLGANILIGLHKWHRAAQFLENVISYPTKSDAISGPMVEAYKIWVLVQLMLEGRVPKLPKMVNSKTSETFHTMAAPYEAVASLFEKGTASRLNAEISAGADMWGRDGNGGLMRLVLDFYQERRILSMASVFTTVPLSYITQETDSADNGGFRNERRVVELIAKMIQRSQLHGKLTTDSNGRSFLCFDRSEHGQDELMATQIPAAVAGVNELMEDVRAVSRSITTEKDYLKWIHKQKKNNGVIGAQAMMIGDSGWPVGPDDEDLMAN